MAHNNGCLYNKIPEAYFTMPKTIVNTVSKTNSTHKRKNPNRRLSVDFTDSKVRMLTYFYKSGTSLRVVNIGKHHVVFQLESKHGDFGIERTAKIISKGKKTYFEFKNNKFILQNKMTVI